MHSKTMKMPPQVKGNKYRLSPNEEARLLKEEREKRRKLRIVQVREQAKANAARIREAVKQEQDKQLQILASKLQTDWQNVQQQKVADLEKQYHSSLHAVGESHYEANQPDHRSELRAALLKEDKRKAEERFRVAMEKLKEQNFQKEQEENQHIFARKIALERERLRANQIASLPPPPPDPLLNVQLPKTRPVQIIDKDAFSTSYFHMSEGYTVDRAEPEQQTDARTAAVEEMERTEDLEAGIRRSEQERMEKARLRHKHARNKELLKRDYNQMLLDLSDLQRADRHRRQQIVADIPKKVFLPPHKRLEESEDKQQSLEQAFEDMYMASTDYMGDITLALDPHPVPDTPAASEALDLSYDGTADAIGQVKSVFKDLTNQKTPEKKKQLIDKDKTPDSGLRRLLGKIKAQRNEWATSSSQEVGHLDEEAMAERTKPPPEVVLVPSKPHYDTVSLSGGSIKSGSQLTDTSETFRSTEISNTVTSSSVMTGKSSLHSSTDTATSENLERFRRINEETEEESDTLSVRACVPKPASPINLDRFQRDRNYPRYVSEEATEPSMEESIITGSPTLYHPMEQAARTRVRALQQQRGVAVMETQRDVRETEKKIPASDDELPSKQHQLTKKKKVPTATLS